MALGGSAANTVRVFFQAMTEPLQRGIQQVRSSLTSLQSSASSTGSALSTTFTNLDRSASGSLHTLTRLKILLGSIFSLYAGKKLFEFTFGEAAEFEHYEMIFTSLLDSAEEAKHRIEELTEFNVFSPFEIKPIIEADKFLQIYGVRSQAVLKRIGDAAAVSGNDIQEVAYWFGRLASGDTGRALMRFSQMGITTRRELREMGLEFSKNNEYLGDLNVLANSIMEVMTKPRFADGMKKLSTTYKGAVSNLLDAFNLFRREIGEAALEQLKTAVIALTAKIWQLKQSGKLDEWGQAIGRTVANVINWFLKVVNNLDTIAENIATIFAFISEHVGKLAYAVIFLITRWTLLKASTIAAVVAMKGWYILQGVIVLVRSLAAGLGILRSAQLAYNAALAANPIGLVLTLISMLVAWIIYWASTTEAAGARIKRVFRIIEQWANFAALGIYSAFNSITQFLFGWTGLVTNIFGWAFDYLDERILKTGREIAKLDKEIAEAERKANEIEKEPEIDMPHIEDQPFDPFKHLDFSGSGVDTGGGTKKDAIDKLEEQYKYKIDTAENRADWSERQVELGLQNNSMWREQLLSLKSVLQNKLDAVRNIISTTSGKLREKAEAKQYDILKKIADLNKDIRDKISNLVQEFNLPGGISPENLLQARATNFEGAGTYTVSGANFVFQVNAVPKTTEEWRSLFDKSFKAISDGLESERSRGPF